MKKSYYRVKLGHGRVTFEALAEKSRTNVTMMTGNASYATPNPPLVDITAAADRLTTAVDAYNFTGSRLDKEERDNSFNAMKDLRSGLGAYVQNVSNGDQTLITSAGFDTMKARQPFGVLPAPGNMQARALPYPGQVEVRFDGVDGRIAYQVSICSGDPKVEADWSLCTTTSKNRVTVEGLVTNTQYFFRVVALGAAGASPVSNLATAKAA